jgi:hypothetical protein
MDPTRAPYEVIIDLLRTDLPADMRDRLQAELKSRDRAEYNLWVATFGGEFR